MLSLQSDPRQHHQMQQQQQFPLQGGHQVPTRVLFSGDHCDPESSSLAAPSNLKLSQAVNTTLEGLIFSVFGIECLLVVGLFLRTQVSGLAYTLLD